MCQPKLSLSLLARSRMSSNLLPQRWMCQSHWVHLHSVLARKCLHFDCIPTSIKCHSLDVSFYEIKDVEVEYGNKRKDVCQSAPPRTRAAEVHNLSEQRRRDRINMKMKALQELIPRCNKSDKASMLDNAIEYMKSLQLQVQMMSPVQYNMGQMLFPDAQRYLLTMGFMGMGMGMPSWGMQRPVMPFGSILPYPPVAGLSPANLWPQLVPSFYPATAAIPDPVRIEASTQQDPVSNSIRMVGPNMVQIPNFAVPYHHYAPLHHLQVPSQRYGITPSL